jgi:long-chain acyl-CoA synthetase
MSDQTLNDLLRYAVTHHPQPAMFQYKHDGRWVDVATEEFARGVLELSQGLVSLGVEPGDRVALLSENRVEWAMADLAILAAGAVVVPIYPSLLSGQIQYILQDSEPVAMFCSTTAQAKKLEPVEAPSVHTVIGFEPVDVAEVLTLRRVRELGMVHHRNHPDDAARRSEGVAPTDVATIIYTSGTTGNPKGVLLTHENLVQNVLSGLERLEIVPDDVCLSFLPLSHVLERMAGHYTMLYSGATIAYAESPETVAADLLAVRPTVMISVPRLYEKIYARVLEKATESSTKRRIFFWAKSVGEQVAQRRLCGQKVGSTLALQARVADALVFRKLRAGTGGRMRFFVSGGAPLSKEIGEFFYAAGLLILEGYGLTETSPVIAVNTPQDLRFGSVGKPIPRVEVRLADDGEILVQGPSVTIGYHNAPQATAAALADGWFHTGDIGRLDDDGFLYITDRKKDIIVTAGGKNIAPQPIENALKLSRYVTEAVLVGDRRRYVVALLVPNFESLEAFASREDIPYADRQGLLASTAVQGLFQGIVDRVNATLPRYEQVKYFRLLASDFTQESGELTPSLKVRRRVVQERFAEQIESMYPQ